MWNSRFSILYDSILLFDSIRLHVMDKDLLSKDDFVGEICIDLSQTSLVNTVKKESKSISPQHVQSKIVYEYSIYRNDPLLKLVNSKVNAMMTQSTSSSPRASTNSDESLKLTAFSSPSLSGLNLFIPLNWTQVTREAPEFGIIPDSSIPCVTFINERGFKDEENLHVEVGEHVTFQCVTLHCQSEMSLEQKIEHVFREQIIGNLQKLHSSPIEIVFEEQSHSAGKLFEKDSTLFYYHIQYVYKNRKYHLEEPGVNARYFFITGNSGDSDRALIVKFATEHSVYESSTLLDKNGNKDHSLMSRLKQATSTNTSNPLQGGVLFSTKPKFFDTKLVSGDKDITPQISLHPIVRELQQVLTKLSFD